MRRDHAVAGALLCAALVSLSRTHAGAHPLTDVTWTRDVGPILQYRCGVCHHSGGSGPMDLTDYAQARVWGQAIKRSVLERRMPPWQASPGYGDFVNDRSLTPYEVALIAAWVNGGMRVGAPAPDAATRSVTGPSHDTLVIGGSPIQISTTTRTLGLPPSPQVRWISGWDFRPGDAGAVRDATISIGDIVVGTWSAGDPAVQLPDGVAHRLPAGAAVTLGIRYRDAQLPTVDRSALEIRVASPPRREMAQLRLRAGSRTLAHSIDLFSIRPIMPTGGNGIQVIVTRPDRSVDALLVVDRYDADSSVSYRFRRPVTLTAGTRIEVISHDRQAEAIIDFAAANGGASPD